MQSFRDIDMPVLKIEFPQILIFVVVSGLRKSQRYIASLQAINLRKVIHPLDDASAYKVKNIGIKRLIRFYFYFLFYYLVMNILLRGMITDHLSNTYVPGTNGRTSIGFKTLTTSGAGFPVRDLQSFPLPVLVHFPHLSIVCMPCHFSIVRICFLYCLLFGICI